MEKKKKIMIGAAVIVVAAVGACVFLNKGGGAAGGVGGMGGRGGMVQEAAVTVVKAEVPARGDLSVTTSLTGTVESEDVVYVYAKASGDVTAVHVKAGDMVEAGQVLCEIDTEQVDTAKNSLDSAQVNLSEAQSNLSRMQILHNSGDLSDQEYEQYTNQLRSAQLQYESAKLSYDRQVEYSTITAPISGRIETCNVEVYDRISQSDQLCVIAGEGESRITFYVSQRMVNHMSVGDEIEIVKNSQTYEGSITEISSMVDSSSGLFEVKASMESTDEIAIGSTVKLNVVTDRAEGAMLVPVNAIYYSGGDAFVYLYKDGVAAMVPVEVGLYDSDFAEIQSGLSADDLVVGTWSSNLYEGAKIRLIDEVSAADGAQDGAAADAGGAAQADGENPPADAGEEGNPAAGTGGSGTAQGGQRNAE